MENSASLYDKMSASKRIVDQFLVLMITQIWGDKLSPVDLKAPQEEEDEDGHHAIT